MDIPEQANPTPKSWLSNHSLAPVTRHIRPVKRWSCPHVETAVVVSGIFKNTKAKFEEFIVFSCCCVRKPTLSLFIWFKWHFYRYSTIILGLKRFEQCFALQLVSMLTLGHAALSSIKNYLVCSHQVCIQDLVTVSCFTRNKQPETEMLAKSQSFSITFAYVS